MADVYRFFQAAVTHDRGQFMETLEWALESYSNGMCGDSSGNNTRAHSSC